MDELLLLARAVLALVFVTAAVAKFADREGTEEAIIGFGVPRAMARPGAVLLPLAELATAVALIPGSTAYWGATAALALLVLFIVGISINLAQGRKPDCNCFGQLHSEPVGTSTLVRNTVLSALAAFVLWGPEAPGPSYASYLAGLAPITRLALISGIVALGLLVLQAWLWWSLLRQHGRLISRVDFLEKALQDGGTLAAAPEASGADSSYQGLPVGSAAPDFTLSGLFGETLTLQALLARGRPTMLIFTDPGCGPCNDLMPDVAQWQQSPATNATIALISRGTVEANRAKADTYGVTNLLLQEDSEVAEAYRYNGTPCAIVVGTDGTIAQPMSCGAPAIRDLATTLVGSALPMAANGNGSAPAAQGLAIGDEAPQISLKSLAGKTVKLSDFKGSETLLLFWDPGCGFCQNILDDIKAWEQSASDDAPQLVIVTTNDATRNMAEGLRSPMLLDDGFKVGNEYSAPGTPSAVLIDAEGRIASEVAVGGPAVLELAGAAPAQAG